NSVHSRRQHVLKGLMPPPDLADPEPMANLVSLLGGTLEGIAQFEGEIATTGPDIAKMEFELRQGERAGAGNLLSGRSESLARRRILIGLSGVAVTAAVILCLILVPGWFNRLNSGSSEGTDMLVDPATGAGIKADKDDPKPNLSASQEGAEVARGLRLKLVRQLLHKARLASDEGKYLDAVLAFGQAAVLYPQELREVDNPEKVRVQFLDALKRYQAEVEGALQNAGK